MTPNDATAQGMWGKGGGGAVNPQELNRYSYVNNNPVKYTDPTGHCIGPVILICIAAGGAAATEAAAAAGAVIVGAFVVAGAWIAGEELGKAQAATTNNARPKQSEESKEFLDNTDPQSWEGKTPQEVEAEIPKDWVKGPAKKGGGTKYSNPARPGETIIIEGPWPNSTDPLHGGKYVRVTHDGDTFRIPLKGNPALDN